MRDESNNTQRKSNWRAHSTTDYFDMDDESSKTRPIPPPDHVPHFSSLRGQDDFTASRFHNIECGDDDSTERNSKGQQDKNRLSQGKSRLPEKLSSLFQWAQNKRKPETQNKPMVQSMTLEIIQVFGKPGETLHHASNTIKLEQTGKTSWLIGRDPLCDIVINPQLTSISRRHATLRFEKGRYRIDIHSPNGIDIDGHSILGGSYVFDFNNKKTYAMKLCDDNGTVTMTLHSTVTDQWTIPEDEAMNHKNRQDMLRLIMDFESEIQKRILAENQRLAQLQGSILDADEKLNQDVRQNLKDILKAKFKPFADSLSLGQDERDRMFIRIGEEVYDNIMRFGPITPFLEDPSVDEIMVNGPDMIFIRRNGIIEQQVGNIRFYNDEQLMSIIQRIAKQAGRKIDENTHIMEMNMKDGSIATALFPPVSFDGPSLTIRKIKDHRLTIEDLIHCGTMNKEMVTFLGSAIESRQNILISGTPSSGKTALLSTLGNSFIPCNERIVILENPMKCRLTHINKIRLLLPSHAPKNNVASTTQGIFEKISSLGADRVILGKCHDDVAWDMLQILKGGYDGFMTTVNATSPGDALERIANMVLARGSGLPINDIRRQIASSFSLIIQITKLADGSIKITEIAEVTGIERATICLQPLFTFTEKGRDAYGRITGEFVNSGMVSKFMLNKAFKAKPW